MSAHLQKDFLCIQGCSLRILPVMHGQPRVEMERVRPPICPPVPIMLSAGLLCQWKISHGKLGREGSPAPEHRPFPLGQSQLPWGWSLPQGLAVLPRMFTVKGFSWTTSPCLCPASSLLPHRHPTYFSFFWGIKCIHSFKKQLATTYSGSNFSESHQYLV